VVCRYAKNGGNNSTMLGWATSTVDVDASNAKTPRDLVLVVYHAEEVYQLAERNDASPTSF
jgi:hypothetical protein